MSLSFDELKRRRREREAAAEAGKHRLGEIREELRHASREQRGCLSDEELTLHCEGALSLTRRIAAALHLRRCAQCREEVTAFRASISEVTSSTNRVPVTADVAAAARWRIPHVRVVPAASIAVLLLAIFWPICSHGIAVAQFKTRRRVALAKHQPGYPEKLADLPSELIEKMLPEFRRQPERFMTPSVNLFDDVKVYSPNKTFLDESFDTTTLHGFPTTLTKVWGGKLMQVVEFPSAPSGGKCLHNEAYPKWNAHAGIELTPNAVPSGQLTFEVSCYVFDMGKGVTFGLKYVREADSHDNNGVIAIGSGPVTNATSATNGFLSVSAIVGRDPKLARVVAKRWYRVKATVDLKAHTIDVFLDGKQVGNKLPLKEDLSRGNIGPTHYDFNRFSFGGVYFVLNE